MTRADGGRSGNGPSRILLVNQHYFPDVASTGQHLTDLAEHLARDGYDVEVLTGRGRYVAGRMAVPDCEVRNGVTIRRLRTTAFGRGSHLGRICDYLSFYLRVLARLLFGPRREGVIFLTTPPLLSVLGAIARAVRGQRYAVWSMDLHPDAEVASGMLRGGGVVARTLEWANATGYRNADFVVDLGPYMKERLVAKRVAPERTRTIPIWSAKEDIAPIRRDMNPLVDELGLGERFVVMYSGNAGLVHDFRDICEGMRLLKDDPRIYFLFVGDGPRRPQIEAFARDYGIRNFDYRGYFARDQLRYSLSLGDAHLISLKSAFVGISVPGKLYGIMAAARPALFIGPKRCESAETILEAKCGLVLDPEDGGGGARLAGILREWSAKPQLTELLGLNARAAFLSNYERSVSCGLFSQLVANTWPCPPRGADAQTAARTDGLMMPAAYDP